MPAVLAYVALGSTRNTNLMSTPEGCLALIFTPLYSHRRSGLHVCPGRVPNTPHISFSETLEPNTFAQGCSIQLWQHRIFCLSPGPRLSGIMGSTGRINMLSSTSHTLAAPEHH